MNKKMYTLRFEFFKWFLDEKIESDLLSANLFDNKYSLTEFKNLLSKTYHDIISIDYLLKYDDKYSCAFLVNTLLGIKIFVSDSLFGSILKKIIENDSIEYIICDGFDNLMPTSFFKDEDDSDSTNFYFCNIPPCSNIFDFFHDPKSNQQVFYMKLNVENKKAGSSNSIEKAFCIEKDENYIEMDDFKKMISVGITCPNIKYNLNNSYVYDKNGSDEHVINNALNQNEIIDTCTESQVISHVQNTCWASGVLLLLRQFLEIYKIGKLGVKKVDKLKYDANNLFLIKIFDPEIKFVLLDSSLVFGGSKYDKKIYFEYFLENKIQLWFVYFEKAISSLLQGGHHDLENKQINPQSLLQILCNKQAQEFDLKFSNNEAQKTLSFTKNHALLFVEKITTSSRDFLVFENTWHSQAEFINFSEEPNNYYYQKDLENASNDDTNALKIVNKYSKNRKYVGYSTNLDLLNSALCLNLSSQVIYSKNFINVKTKPFSKTRLNIPSNLVANSMHLNLAILYLKFKDNDEIVDYYIESKTAQTHLHNFYYEPNEEFVVYITNKQDTVKVADYKLILFSN